jgi:E3 ubiquitin-protein ligase UBR4
MQVVLMLTTDLESTEDKDRAILDKLLQTFIEELKLEGNPESGAADRDNLKEVQLVVMRLFSVLMSRSKSWQGL